MPKPRGMRVWTLTLALLCIGLVVFGTTLQVAHSHPDHVASHADCALCVVAHGTAVAAAPAITLVTATLVSQVEAAVPAMRTATPLGFALFTRPPPVDAFPA